MRALIDLGRRYDRMADDCLQQKHRPAWQYAIVFATVPPVYVLGILALPVLSIAIDVVEAVRKVTRR
jgi:hypothetical protein